MFCIFLSNYCICTVYRYRWAFVPEVDVNRYNGPESAFLEGEQECTPHVVRILERIQQRYGVRLTMHTAASNRRMVRVTIETVVMLHATLPVMSCYTSKFDLT